MSASTIGQTTGFKRNLVGDGEVLAWSYQEGSRSVTALVNRHTAGAELRRHLAEVPADFQTQGVSCVEFLKSAVSAPVSGDSFLDGFGYRHRARYVAQTDITWMCFCTPSVHNPKIQAPQDVQWDLQPNGEGVANASIVSGTSPAGANGFMARWKLLADPDFGPATDVQQADQPIQKAFNTNDHAQAEVAWAFNGIRVSAWSTAKDLIIP